MKMVIKIFLSAIDLSLCSRKTYQEEGKRGPEDFHNSFYPTGYLMWYSERCWSLIFPFSSRFQSQCIRLWKKSGKTLWNFTLQRRSAFFATKSWRIFTIMIIFMWIFFSLSLWWPHDSFLWTLIVSAVKRS